MYDYSGRSTKDAARPSTFPPVPLSAALHHKLSIRVQWQFRRRHNYNNKALARAPYVCRLASPGFHAQASESALISRASLVQTEQSHRPPAGQPSSSAHEGCTVVKAKAERKLGTNAAASSSQAPGPSPVPFPPSSFPPPERHMLCSYGTAVRTCRWLCQFARPRVRKSFSSDQLVDSRDFCSIVARCSLSSIVEQNILL